MTNKVNDLSKAEILAMQTKMQREERPCLWCEKAIKMLPNQQFCSAKCRAAYSNAAARIAYETLLMEKAVWRKEREEFVREVADLQNQLARK